MASATKKAHKPPLTVPAYYADEAKLFEVVDAHFVGSRWQYTVRNVAKPLGSKPDLLDEGIVKRMVFVRKLQM
jgi:hypothetical protein